MGDVNDFPECVSILIWCVAVLFHMGLDGRNLPGITRQKFTEILG